MVSTAVAAHRRRAQSPLSTREAIKKAADELFGRNGFARTSVREIARAAGVDPALVIRHFGSKEALFIETVPAHGPFDAVLSGPLDGFGERIVEYIISEVNQQTFAVFVEVLRASGSEAIRQRMGEMMRASFSKLRDQLTGPDADLRTRLVAAHVTGLLVSLAHSRHLSAQDHQRIVEIYGAAIQSTVAPPKRRGSRSR